jgi:hypothetical protein
MQCDDIARGLAGFEGRFLPGKDFGLWGRTPAEIKEGHRFLLGCTLALRLKSRPHLWLHIATYTRAKIR